MIFSSLQTTRKPPTQTRWRSQGREVRKHISLPLMDWHIIFIPVIRPVCVVAINSDFQYTRKHNIYTNTVLSAKKVCLALPWRQPQVFGLLIASEHRFLCHAYIRFACKRFWHKKQYTPDLFRKIKRVLVGGVWALFFYDNLEKVKGSVSVNCFLWIHHGWVPIVPCGW